MMTRPFTSTSRKGKTPKTMAVNLSAWLRAYAADEQSGVEAVRRAQNARESTQKANPLARELRRK